MKADHLAVLLGNFEVVGMVEKLAEQLDGLKVVLMALSLAVWMVDLLDNKLVVMSVVLLGV